MTVARAANLGPRGLRVQRVDGGRDITTPPARVFDVQLRAAAADTEVWVRSVPRPMPSELATQQQQQDGNKMQMHLVMQALDRKYQSDSESSSSEHDDDDATT